MLLCSEIKERIKKTKDEKKAKKAEVAAKSQKAGGKSNISRGAMPKGPKLGGGGGKRWAYKFCSSFCYNLISVVLKLLYYYLHD